MAHKLWPVVIAWLALGVVAPAAVRAQAAPDTSLDAFVLALEAAVQSGSPDAYRALVSTSVDEDAAAAFAEDLVHPDTTGAVVRERDRVALDDGGVRLLVEIFVEIGRRGRVATVGIELVREGPGPGEPWRIREQERLTSVDGLYRLALDESKQFAVRDLVVRAEDLTLSLPRGTVFVAEADGGRTALVLIGEGRMQFSPRPPAERVQVRIFSGNETLDTPFSAAFIRLNPIDFDNRVSAGAFEEVGVERRARARARAIFEEDAGKSFTLDLGDLSREPWSLVPGVGDFLAEVRTRRHRTLTYARSSSEPEDITLFDRQRRRNISVYPSLRRLQSRGPFYNEDDLADFEVLDYNIDAAYSPERFWLDGRAQLRIRVRSFALTTLTLRFAESLTPQSVVSDRHGRLLSIRVRGQNSLLVSLPTAETRGTVFHIVVRYSGRLEPPPPDREVVTLEAGQTNQAILADAPLIVPEARWLLTNRSHWYPQSTSGNYATGRLRLTVPAGYDVVASGAPAASNPELLPATEAGEHASKRFLFVAGQPLRYFSWLITRLVPSTTATVELSPAATAAGAAHRSALDSASDGEGPYRLTINELPEGPRGVYYGSTDVTVVANGRQVGRGRALVGPLTEILRFYGELLGDLPFPTFTLALVDAELPGGHSPGYFAVLNQPLPTSPFFWRNDPVYFDSYPHFFLAHELAHQFWGQAVGWKNYHEQWLSEGFAQYFAFLYAEARRDPGVARDILRRMNRSATSAGNQGPIWLGYRLGHIKGDSRIFRSVVYNKGALVLHMLRRLVGDERFFEALGRFYHESRFRKVGTDDLRRTFEGVTGWSLERFFERWVFNQGTPTVFSRWAVADGGTSLAVTFEQRGPVYDVPVTVTLTLASGEEVEHVVPLTEATTVWTVAIDGPVRQVSVNADHAALGSFERR
jgi:hypothetical protein